MMDSAETDVRRPRELGGGPSDESMARFGAPTENGFENAVGERASSSLMVKKGPPGPPLVFDGSVCGPPNGFLNGSEKEGRGEDEATKLLGKDVPSDAPLSS